MPGVDNTVSGQWLLTAGRDGNDWGATGSPSGHRMMGELGLGLLSFSLMVTFKYGWLRYVGIDYQASFVQTPLPALLQ